MHEPLVYLNGDFLPLSQARISVLDRGFLFGDGVYEVIPVYGGHPFRLRQHLDRLGDSLRGIRLEPPFGHDEWERIAAGLLDGREADQSLYLQITRGAAGNRDHAFPVAVTPTVFAMASPIPSPNTEKLQKGIAVVTLDDVRWQLCHIKSITLLANVLLRQQATDEGCDEAILIRDGQATEGTVSNLFIVKDGLILTPPKSHHLLPGITRDLVLELAASANLPCAEALIGLPDLESADEIWLTSSTREVMAVTTLNGRAVSDGTPGPLWRRMIQLYQACKERLRTGADY
ncbi:MAG: D-amino acid aminotransferase [Gammaproteobacteria bacterium]|nr:D-amino acid aminotransferase [Gammaproteobacteria bacterium]MBU1653289.1 D-amino acid aminotransferase [Gammaproteobacteria bacterium]MBU1961515.1 D-amino acid aminotransferase [Gammaproteobacteria bacterium]